MCQPPKDGDQVRDARAEESALASETLERIAHAREVAVGAAAIANSLADSLITEYAQNLAHAAKVAYIVAYYSSSEESESDSESLPKEPGRVDERKIPPVWDQVTPRDLSEFERLTLEIKPMTDDQCWEDALSQKEENRANAEAAGRGKRRGAPDGAGGADASPPESPPPPNGVAPRSRKSARIIAKVNRGATYTSYKHLMSGRGTGGGPGHQGHHHGRGRRMSLTGGGRGAGLTGGVQALSTVAPELPPKEDVRLELKRNPKEMSLMAADRAGLHQLPPECMERIVYFLAKAEGREELKAQREALMKSLGKAK